jgi:hypothetical protein
MAVKACTGALFEEKGPSDIETKQRLGLASSIFKRIETMLNPFEVVDSLEKEKYFRAKLPEYTLPPGRGNLTT